MRGVTMPATKPAESALVSSRLIVALDVADIDAARALVETLDDSVRFYKIGLELAMSGHYFELMRWLLDNGKEVFADLKFHDIPATVGAAVRQLRDSGASLLTVHSDRGTMEAAAHEKGADLRVVAVTVLTSIGQEDLALMGIERDLAALALDRARLAMRSGCDGVVASGLEAAALRTALGPQALIVTPGIRPAAGDLADQKRVVTPRAAFESGASYIVVGRPIRGADDPRAAALAIQSEIADVAR
jgi:orotidine-5'-phosphate decarboxylase